VKLSSGRSLGSSSKGLNSKKPQSCKKAPYYKEYNETAPNIIHDLTKGYEDLGCIEVEIHPYYNVKKRPYERLLYPDFKWEDKPLPRPQAIRQLPSIFNLNQLKKKELIEFTQKLDLTEEDKKSLKKLKMDQLIKLIEEKKKNIPKKKWKEIYSDLLQKATKSRGGVKYKVEYFNITPEEIDEMSENGEIEKVLFIHGAHHSVNLFLKHKDEAQLAVYCHPLLSMGGEREYILRYIDKFKYPFAIITMTEPELPDLLRSNGVPKAMEDLSPRRWCTRLFKLRPSYDFLRNHNLKDIVGLKGIQYHQSSSREKRAKLEEKVRDDPFCYDKEGLKEEGFVFQTLSPDFRDEELDNYKNMVKNQIPINNNCRLLDRHGCVFCPYAGTKYYDYIKENRPADYEKCKQVVRWASANRIKKYNYIENNIKRFSKGDITREDMKDIIELLYRDRDWYNREEKVGTPIKKVIETSTKKNIDKLVKEYEQEHGKKPTKKMIQEFKKESMYTFVDTQDGKKKIYEYLQWKLDGWDKHSKKGLYILYDKRPDLLTEPVKSMEWDWTY
jgi:3'-phosphoadenosine 5'-phosphosulfate sulfotransferase (PAPS reductase)/FAD synthetase